MNNYLDYERDTMLSTHSEIGELDLAWCWKYQVSKNLLILTHHGIIVNLKNSLDCDAMLIWYIGFLIIDAHGTIVDG